MSQAKSSAKFDKHFRYVHMNLSSSGVRPSPVALGLVTQEYCNCFIHSVSQWWVFLFMYGVVNDVTHSSGCIMLNGVMISEKLMHKFEERSDCVLIVETVQAHAWRD